jgi:hypothetical protein
LRGEIIEFKSFITVARLIYFNSPPGFILIAIPSSATTSTQGLTESVTKKMTT